MPNLRIRAGQTRHQVHGMLAQRRWPLPPSIGGNWTITGCRDLRRNDWDRLSGWFVFAPQFVGFPSDGPMDVFGLGDVPLATGARVPPNRARPADGRSGERNPRLCFP